MTRRPANSHAWFASFAPYDDPEIVLVILVEHGGEGSQTAAPVAREVYQWYFNTLNYEIEFFVSGWRWDPWAELPPAAFQMLAFIIFVA